MNNGIGTALIVGIGWLMSLCFHEFGHALIAYIAGDKSVKDKGYLTLNPLKYTDPGLTLVIPLLILMIGGIALPGAAVYIDYRYVRNRAWMSLVSLAGPVFSLVALLIIAVPFMFNLWPDTHGWLYASFALLALLESVCILLNVLPIPPLDGFGVIRPWLPPTVREAANKFGRYGIWIVFLALWFVRPLNELMWTTAYIMISYLNIEPAAAGDGYNAFQHQSYLLMAVIVVVLIITNRNKKTA
ncbi:MAG TPA: site-2 protease family protein [Planktothrix sp.]|jgi:Zn-dependent protease